MVLGVVFIVVVLGFVAILVWAQRAGAKRQEDFFRAVTSGSPGQVTAQFHPALLEEVDEPVLGAWMQVVKEQLGAFKGLRKTDFDTSVKYEGGVKVTESKGTVEFEKGEASSELVLHGDQVTKFHVASAKIPEDWFKGPTSTELYRERGKVFLTHFLSDRPDEAFKSMHKALQENAPLEKLKGMMAEVAGKAGALKSMSHKSESYDPASQKLEILYSVACEKAKLVMSAKFQFVGLKGHLVAFNFNSETD